MGRGNKILFGGSGSHDQGGCHAIYGKKSFKIFSGTNGPMTLGLGMQHQGLGVQQYKNL